LKLLCAADLHIGRRPARLPRSWAGGRISAAHAWDDLVARALDLRVDAVLLAGDVVDQDNRYFEAWGPIGRGVRRLKEAGIAVVAVAGNHDHHTLHEVAAEVGAGHLVVLGRGGRWERWTLRGADGSPRLHVDGWSFPAARHADDPTASYDLAPPDDGAPVLGLLHCDLDGREPRYAPVPTASLARIPVAAWVLGHIHKPDLRHGLGPPSLYPGSLLALDPGEPGRRGAWLLELDGRRPPSFHPVPLSRVRYETVTVPVDGVEDVDTLRGVVGAALQGRLAEVVEADAGPLALLSFRVRLTGRTALHADIAPALANLGDLDLSEGGVRLTVERVDADVRPALDLDDLARGSDAPALLARLLIGLEHAPGPDHGSVDPDLMSGARRAAASIAARPYYAALQAAGGDDAAAVAVDGGAEPDSPAAVRAALRRQASRLLDELMGQKEPA
jgi:DNA repair protein SbcD/Mre11